MRVSVVCLALLSSVAMAQSDLPEDEAHSSSGELALAELALAKYRCEAGDQVRRIEVDSEVPGQRLPCAVYYYKDTESPGKVSTLWTAQNREGYCEEQASMLAEKLNELGWSCTEESGE